MGTLSQPDDICVTCGALVAPGADVCPTCRTSMGGVTPDTGEIEQALAHIGAMVADADAPGEPIFPKGTPAAETPEDAARCYFREIAHARWANALRFLSPFAFQRACQRPGVPALGVPSHQTRFQSPDRLRDYWTALVEECDERSNELNDVAVARGRIAAIGAVGLSITLGFRHTGKGWLPGVPTQLVLEAQILSKKIFMRFDAVAVRFRSRWLMLTGELAPTLDRALLDRRRGAR